jgi:hypothetical protein
MRPVLLALALLAGPGLFFAACSQDAVSAATSTSGTGGAPNCEGVYFDLTDKDGSAPCNICAYAHCCAEMAACRDKTCLLCANDSTGAGCPPQSQRLEDCVDLYCLSTCSPGWHYPTSSTSGG